MDRLAHQRPLDHAPPLERPRQVVALEPLDGRPEADVPVRRVLVLDPADPLEHPRDRQAHTLEEQLPGEERPVQLPRRQDSLGHGWITNGDHLRGCRSCSRCKWNSIGVEAALVNGKLDPGNVEVREGASPVTAFAAAAGGADRGPGLSTSR